MLEIDLKRVEDPIVRDALYKILEIVREEPLLNSKFKFFSKTYTTGGTYRFPHGLGFKPKHWMTLDVTNDASAYVNPDNSTNTLLEVTVSDACRFDFVAGRLDVNSQA